MCRLLLSIKITIVLTWTIVFRTNCVWSWMILLNKVCHIVGKTSRECPCMFMTEDLCSGCSPDLFAYVLSLQRRTSSRRHTSRPVPLSFFPCLPAQTHFRSQQVFQQYLLPRLTPNKCEAPAHASCLLYAPTTYPLFPAPQHMLVPYSPTESTSLLVLLISWYLWTLLCPGLGILSTECETSSIFFLQQALSAMLRAKLRAALVPGRSLSLVIGSLSSSCQHPAAAAVARARRVRSCGWGHMEAAWEALPSRTSASRWGTRCSEGAGQPTSCRTGSRQITGRSDEAMLTLVCRCLL